MSPTSLAGSVRWAVVPYAPAPPFRIYAGLHNEPRNVSLSSLLTRGVDAEFTYLTPGKARPVLILNNPPPRLHNEVTALRLVRFSKLDPAEQTIVRDQRDPLLFHLQRERFDLPEENAAIVSALVRINVDAIAEQSCGSLHDEEMRALGERIIEFYRFDTRLLVERQIRQLAARRRASGA